MDISKFLIYVFNFFAFAITIFNQDVVHGFKFAFDNDDLEVDMALQKFNNELSYFRHYAAEIAWDISINMTKEILDKNEEFTIERNIWNNAWCTKLMKMYYDGEVGHSSHPWTMESQRQLYLICRGPRFTSYQLSNVLSILSTMQKLYNKEVCIDGSCMRMEPDLNRFMEVTRDEKKLRQAWIAWHRSIGKDVKPLYVALVHMLNEGARQAGHSDMGQCWREETEIGNLRSVALKLYSDVKYLYTLLHTLVRFKIEKLYNLDFKNGPIPAHLLGNMYAQNWQSLIDVIWEEDNEKKVESEMEKNPLVKSILAENATVTDMVKAAEDFFVSMGLPKLPPKFWKNSYFQDQKSTSSQIEAQSKILFPSEKKGKTNARNCHGSAANMFGRPEPDYRMMMCAELKDEDMITFQHEIGHIMYFMAYENLPTIFQDGANSAFHESVGDSVTYDLKPDMYHGKPTMKSLLKTGLAKLPQVGFGLVMDMWRWDLFENEDAVSSWNNHWWKLNYEIMGIKRTDGEDKKDATEEDRLDAAGKFHIIDNIPYIRYFLASFLQIQFYDAMCSKAGWKDIHSCRIRGSKDAGGLLWRMMSHGTSAHWSLILHEMTGSPDISSEPFLRYFEPLKQWLESQVRKNNLTLGW